MPDIEDQLPTTQSSGRAEQTAGPSANAQNDHVQVEIESQEPSIDQNLPPRPVSRSIWGTIPKKRKLDDYTLSSFYRLPEPMPVSDVLLLKPRRIIFLNFAVRATLLVLTIVTFPLFLILIPFLEIFVALLAQEWPSVISLIRFYFDMAHKTWVSTFRINLRSITEKCLILIPP
jgi:hypothetical protein